MWTVNRTGNQRLMNGMITGQRARSSASSRGEADDLLANVVHEAVRLLLRAPYDGHVGVPAVGRER